MRGVHTHDPHYFCAGRRQTIACGTRNFSGCTFESRFTCLSNWHERPDHCLAHNEHNVHTAVSRYVEGAWPRTRSEGNDTSVMILRCSPVIIRILLCYN